MKKSVSLRVLSDVKQEPMSDGSMWRHCDVIVAWTELGMDGKDHEQRLCCSVSGRSLDRLLALPQPVHDNPPLDVELSFHTYTSRSGHVFNRINLYLPDDLPQT